MNWKARRATARVPAPHPHHSRPYNDHDQDSGVVIVRAGVVEWMGGDPCGRPPISELDLLDISSSIPPSMPPVWARLRLVSQGALPGWVHRRLPRPIGRAAP